MDSFLQYAQWVYLLPGLVCKSIFFYFFVYVFGACDLFVHVCVRASVCFMQMSLCKADMFVSNCGVSWCGMQ